MIAPSRRRSQTVSQVRKRTGEARSKREESRDTAGGVVREQQVPKGRLATLGVWSSGGIWWDEKAAMAEFQARM